MLKKFGPALAFLLVLAGLTVANILYTPPEVSASERRTLQTMPELSLKTIANGKFMSQFEDYALDSFVARDSFRSLKANMHYRVYRQRDNNGIYFVGDYAAKLETLDEQSVAQATDKLVALTALFSENTNFYYAYVPEKGYFLAEANGYPAVDYGRLEQLLAEHFPGMTAIDVAGALAIEDYYYTDLHWNQAQLGDVVDALEAAMNFDASEDYTSQPLKDFYGVYAGQSAMNLSPETLTLLHSDTLENAMVSFLNAETGAMEPGEVYDLTDYAHVDPYDVFLGGPQALITLENPTGNTGRELVIFRDSYTSSLAPLLLAGYDKITLVDLRYISARVLPEYLSVGDNADVLFLYGLQVLNNATVLLA